MTFPRLPLPSHRVEPALAWVFHPAGRKLQYGQVRLTLTRTEFRLLATLVQWPAGAVVPRQALLEALASAAAPPCAQHTASLSAVSPPQRALNMAVSRLRHKARQEGLILPLQTVSGEGYALMVPIITATA